jgi:hypothetical protein
MAHGHPHGGPQARDHRLGGRHTGRTRRNPSHTHPLPPSNHRRRGRDSTTACCPRAFRACLSRLPGNRARPVLRGPRRSNAPGLPDERWFAELTTKLLQRGVHTSVQALEADICNWIKNWKRQPPPVRLDQDRQRDIEALKGRCCDPRERDHHGDAGVDLPLGALRQGKPALANVRSNGAGAPGEPVPRGFAVVPGSAASLEERGGEPADAGTMQTPGGRCDVRGRRHA